MFNLEIGQNGVSLDAQPFINRLAITLFIAMFFAMLFALLLAPKIAGK